MTKAFNVVIAVIDDEVYLRVVLELIIRINLYELSITLMVITRIKKLYLRNIQ